MTDKSQEPELQQTAAALTEIRAELQEIKQLLTERNARPGDLVDTAYVARVTGLKEKTVMEGKAGTDAIPRVMVGRLVRFARRDVDRFVEKLVKKAADNQPQARVQKFLLKRSRRRAA